LTVQDNGKGFNVKQLLTQKASQRGIGIAAMQERVRMLGGSLDIWSQEGSGTRITYDIPSDMRNIVNGTAISNHS
jgi:signal transduction histidine kinase